jgi:hypothetical protein
MLHVEDPRTNGEKPVRHRRACPTALKHDFVPIAETQQLTHAWMHQATLQLVTTATPEQHVNCKQHGHNTLTVARRLQKAQTTDQEHTAW